MRGRPTVVAVIQARMGSSRLPGKVLRPLGDRSVLAWTIRAAQAADEIDIVAVATSVDPGDDAIAEEATSLGCTVVRGSELDVLSRYLLAAQQTNADAVVRLTADCPLADPVLIDQVVRLWRRDPSLDYVSTTLIRTLPRGLDVEVASHAALRWADDHARDHDRVHVTSILYAEGSPMRRAGLVVAPSAAHHRVTLDTAQDAAAIEAIVALLPAAPAGWRDVVAILDSHLEIGALNADVQQKRLEDG